MTTIEYLMSPQAVPDVHAVFIFSFTSRVYSDKPDTRVQPYNREGGWTFTPSDAVDTSRGELVLKVDQSPPVTLQVTERGIDCALPPEVLSVDQRLALTPVGMVQRSHAGLHLTCSTEDRAMAAYHVALAAAQLSDAAVARAA